MSALWAPAEQADRDQPSPGSRRPRRSSRLRAVPAAAPRLARVPFLGVLIAIFGLGMAGLLMLNTTLQTQAFTARTLDRQATELAYGQAELEGKIDTLRAPRELVRRASALGLRPNPAPAFIELPSGKVVGNPTRVKGDEEPLLVIKTPEERAAADAADAAKKAAAARAQQAKERAAAAAAQAKQAAAAGAARNRALAAERQAAAEAAKKEAGR